MVRFWWSVFSALPLLWGSGLMQLQPSDDYVVFAAGVASGSYIVPYDAADDNVIQCSGASSFMVLLDDSPVLVCGEDNLPTTYYWSDTEGAEREIRFDAGAGLYYQYRVAGRHVPRRGDNPYSGVHHWSWYPSVMPGVNGFDLLKLLNELFLRGNVLGGTVMVAIAVILFGFILRMVRKVGGSLAGRGGVGNDVSSYGGRYADSADGDMYEEEGSA